MNEAKTTETNFINAIRFLFLSLHALRFQYSSALQFHTRNRIVSLFVRKPHNTSTTSKWDEKKQSFHRSPKRIQFVLTGSLERRRKQVVVVVVVILAKVFCVIPCSRPHSQHHETISTHSCLENVLPVIVLTLWQAIKSVQYEEDVFVFNSVSLILAIYRRLSSQKLMSNKHKAHYLQLSHYCFVIFREFCSQQLLYLHCLVSSEFLYQKPSVALVKCLWPLRFVCWPRYVPEFVLWAETKSQSNMKIILISTNLYVVRYGAHSRNGASVINVQSQSQKD